MNRIITYFVGLSLKYLISASNVSSPSSLPTTFSSATGDILSFYCTAYTAEDLSHRDCSARVLVDQQVCIFDYMIHLLLKLHGLMILSWYIIMLIIIVSCTYVTYIYVIRHFSTSTLQHGCSSWLLCVHTILEHLQVQLHYLLIVTS